MCAFDMIGTKIDDVPWMTLNCKFSRNFVLYFAFMIFVRQQYNG